MRNLLDFYTTPFSIRDFPDDILCTVFADKRQVSDVPESGVEIPLTMMLVEKFEGDHHFVPYTTPKAMRLRKDMHDEPVRFDFCAFDFDFDEHQSRPTAEDFANFIRSCFVVGCGDVPTPNAVYATRGGARLIYLIRPLTDASLFESHVKAFAKKLAVPFSRGECKYKLDAVATDWTRMFRCPWVCRDDRVKYDYPVRLFHNTPLDLLRFKAVRKKEYVARAPGKIITNLEQRQIMVEAHSRIQPGQRNNTLYKIFFKIWKRWPTQAEELFEHISEIAENAGLARCEIDATFKSAERGAKATG